jgi:hypothetical protein
VPFIAVLLSWGWENSHSRWSSFRGLGQEAVAADARLNRQHADRSSRARMHQLFFTFGNRFVGTLTLAAQRSVIGQRTASLIKQLSSCSGRAAQFVTERIAATNVYRCRDCCRELGFRSRPRTVIERYILPVLLMQPVRCAACFRRDYWLIFAMVRERSHRDHETVDHNHQERPS